MQVIFGVYNLFILDLGLLQRLSWWPFSWGLRWLGCMVFLRVVIESDSLAAINLIKGWCCQCPLHPSFNLIKDIQNLLRLEVSFSVGYILREGNQAADAFAKFSLNFCLCSKFFSCTSDFTSLPVRANLIATFFPRGF